MIRQGMAFIGIDAQKGGIYGQAGSIASKDGFGGLKSPGALRAAAPSRRQLLVQHLRAGRPGAARGRVRAPGRAGAPSA